jgi:histidyl-tRNA synthetase
LPDVFVVGVGIDGRTAASDLVRALRGAGLSVDAPFAERPMKAQLKMADRSGARAAAIVGDDEARAGTVTLKHLADGNQETVPAADVAERLLETR